MTLSLRSNLLKNTDILLAIFVVVILVVMILPIPPTLMDLLLSLSISASLVILLVSMYILKPLDFAVFPSLLLIATLFRLSLNVASTRLILLHGHEGTHAAGHIIEAFGKFVVGGNYVVGFIVFCILVVINFVVITKGAGRIAEVAARFTLDAMPGKQMSIDADLNAGLITEEEARRRRKEIEDEADFYGAMDGASKFVRGDAIASIIITLINIIGGFIIGILQRGMSLKLAAQNYTLLTVGDGLVSQIPALIVSTAAGIVITRAAGESNLGEDVTKQLLFQPKAIAVTSAIILSFAFIPGLPTLPFLILAILTGSIAYFTMRLKKKEEVKKEVESEEEKEERIESLLFVDPLEIEIGYSLIPLVDKEGDLLERIKSIRRQFALDWGFIVPLIRVRDNLQLKPNEYRILIKGVEVAKGEILPDRYLAMSPEEKEKIDGIPTKEPVFGLNAYWIKKEEKEKAQLLGYTVVDAATVLITHLSEIIKEYAHEILSRKDVESLLENLSKIYPKIVEDLIPNVLSLGCVQKVLQNLLKEKVPIKDLQTILETLINYGQYTKDPEILTEYVREALARTICKNLTSNNKLYVLTFDPELEKILVENLKTENQESYYLDIDPDLAQKIIQAIQEKLEKIISLNLKPVILTLPQLRRHIKALVEKFIPQLYVISHNEIPKNIEVEVIDIIKI